MHIPSHYISPSTCAIFGVAMIPVWKLALSKLKQELPKNTLQLIGLGAAFSFLLMMFNMPLPGGTTGHMVGAALIALLLGPFSAAISVSTAIIVQALMFGDGGVLEIGANAFNMAFVMPFAAHYINKFIKGSKQGGVREYLAVFAAGYFSLNIAALLTALELGIQPLLFNGVNGLPIYCPYPLSVSIPAMVIPHLLVGGLVEGFVTVLAYASIRNMQLKASNVSKGLKLKPVYALIVVMILLSPIGLVASGTAWGEWGVDELQQMIGYVPQAIGSGFNFNSIMPDYKVAGIDPTTGYIVSALAGTAVLFMLSSMINNRLVKVYIRRKN